MSMQVTLELIARELHSKTCKFCIQLFEHYMRIEDIHIPPRPMTNT